jgi:hypothetical protein
VGLVPIKDFRFEVEQQMSMKDSSGLPNVQIPREVPIVKHHFIDYFKGFEKVPAVREIFGNATEKVLSEL